MSITVKGKQIDVGDALRTYVGDTLGQAVAKYFSEAYEAQVVLSRDAHLFVADIQVHVDHNGLILQSHGEAGEPYPAFDMALEKLASQLQRYKARIANHRRREKSTEAHSAALTYVLRPQEEQEDKADHDQPVVIAEMASRIDTLTVSEAVMRMDLADLPALLFKNSAHGGLNMVYRRTDGNIGWVDPAGNKV